MLGAGFIRFHQLFQKLLVMGADHCSLLKHHKFDFAHFRGGGGGVTLILNLNFWRVG